MPFFFARSPWTVLCILHLLAIISVPQNTMVSGKYLGFPAILAEVREIFDDKIPICVRSRWLFAKSRRKTFLSFFHVLRESREFIKNLRKSNYTRKCKCRVCIGSKACQSCGPQQMLNIRYWWQQPASIWPRTDPPKLEMPTCPGSSEVWVPTYPRPLWVKETAVVPSPPRTAPRRHRTP